MSKDLLNNKPDSNLLDFVIEEMIFHYGYSLEFDKLSRDAKLRILSAAIDDPRFDKYELLCEGDLYIERIVKQISQGDMDEMEIGKTIIDCLLSSISLSVQEMIDEQCADMRTLTQSNDIKLYEEEVVRAVFG